MKLRDRDGERRNAPTAAGPAAPGDLAAVRERAARMAEAGDAAIDRALSTDSARFLRQVRQQGGE
jgi:hypothetical protein